MGMASHEVAPNPVSPDILERGFSPLYKCACNTLYAHNKNYLVVLLPCISSMSHSNTVMTSVEYLEGKTDLPKTWLIDFSAVRNFPALVVGSLMYHQTRLRDMGGDLFISWFSEKLLEPWSSNCYVRYLT